MRRIGIPLAVMLSAMFLFGLVVTPESAAARGKKSGGSGGWGAESRYNRMYDPKTVETITGEVVSVRKIRPLKGMGYGVHLMVKTDKETVSVHLGPGWFIDNQDIRIEPKDTVEVRGSRIDFEGKPAVIAAEVKKGGETLTLRDENGVPVWSGWRRR